MNKRLFTIGVWVGSLFKNKKTALCFCTQQSSVFQRLTSYPPWPALAFSEGPSANIWPPLRWLLPHGTRFPTAQP